MVQSPFLLEIKFWKRRRRRRILKYHKRWFYDVSKQMRKLEESVDFEIFWPIAMISCRDFMTSFILIAKIDWVKAEEACEGSLDSQELCPTYDINIWSKNVSDFEEWGPAQLSLYIFNTFREYSWAGTPTPQNLKHSKHQTACKNHEFGTIYVLFWQQLFHKIIFLFQYFVQN